MDARRLMAAARKEVRGDMRHQRTLLLQLTKAAHRHDRRFDDRERRFGDIERRISDTGIVTALRACGVLGGRVAPRG